MSKHRLSGRPELRVAVGDGVWVVAGPEGARVQAEREIDRAVGEDILVGPGEGLSAYARGAAVLHGSCIFHGGLGVSVVGPAGAGKSTLTAWLAGRGAELVSDGITIVDPHTRQLQWRQPRWRLRDDSVEFLGRRPEALPFDDPERYKRAFVAPRDQDHPDAVLDVVLTIEQGEQVEVVDLPGMDQLLALVRDWYLVTSLPASESPVVLDRASQLLRAGVRVAKLVRPKQWTVFPSVADAVSRYLGV